MAPNRVKVGIEPKSALIKQTSIELRSIIDLVPKKNYATYRTTINESLLNTKLNWNQIHVMTFYSTIIISTNSINQFLLAFNLMLHSSMTAVFHFIWHALVFVKNDRKLQTLNLKFKLKSYCDKHQWNFKRQDLSQSKPASKLCSWTKQDSSAGSALACYVGVQQFESRQGRW